MSEKLPYWVTTSKHVGKYLIERAEDIQAVNMVLYIPPTQTQAESAFSELKALLRPRRSSMTPKNCNVRMVGRSAKRYKRKLQTIQTFSLPEMCRNRVNCGEFKTLTDVKRLHGRKNRRIN